GLTVTVNATSVTLTSGGTKFVAATISPTSTTAGGAYDLILNATGVSGITLIYATDLNVTVTVPDFGIVASPASLVNPLGSCNSTTRTLSSINTVTRKRTLPFTIIPSLAS